MRHYWTLLLLWYPLCHSFSAESSGRRFFTFINGGASPASNFFYFEEELLAAKAALGASPARVLSGAGPGGPVLRNRAKGKFFLDASGVITVQASAEPEIDGPARRSDVLALFDELRRGQWEELTFVFRGHGNPDGLLLWEEGRNLSAEELHDFYRSLPPATRVRSIHSHCHSGAAVVPLARQLPTRLSEWPAYLDKHYRPGTCTLALGGTDEFTRSIDLPNTPRSTMTWYRLLSQPGISLSRLQLSLAAIPDYGSTPLLTSDFLIDDLGELFCADALEAAPPERRSSAFALSPVSEPRRGPFRGGEVEPCAPDRTLRDADDNLAAWRRAYLVWDAAIQISARRYAAWLAPDKMASYRVVEARLQSLRSEFARRHGPRPGLAAQRAVESAIAEAKTADYDWVERLILSLATGELNRASFNAFIHQADLRRALAADPLLKGENDALFEKILTDYPKSDFLQIEYWLSRSALDSSRHRLRIFETGQPQRRRFVRSRLQAPEYRFLAERLESIKQCETSSLK